MVFEENDQVLLGSPNFGDLIGNEVLVTDDATHQVIIYDAEGRIKNNFGRYGRGPGDLENPTSAIKLSNGEIIVTEFKGRISKFDSSGNFKTVTNADIVRLNNSKFLPNGKVLLIGGMHAPVDNFLLYLFNPESMNIEKRFFLLPFDPAEYDMHPLTLAEPSYAVVCGDKIVAAHSMLPELFYYDFEGNLIESMRLNSELFKQMEKLSTPSNPQKTMEAYGKASWIDNLFCISDDEILIQFFANLIQNGNPISLMLVNENGDVIDELPDMPEILFSNPATDTLFIRDQNSDSINQLLKSKLIID
ncbi:MAG: 6-bladed beta-propeller [Gracilimonas sp.]